MDTRAESMLRGRTLNIEQAAGFVAERTLPTRSIDRSDDMDQTRRNTPRGHAALLLFIACGARAAAPEAPSHLDEIVVVGAKTARPRWSVPAPVTVITQERLSQEQAQSLGDLSRYEATLESDVDTPRFGATGVSIRGIGGNRVALEFDGVPLPQQFNVGNFADSGRLSLDPAVIKRIEILRGPASALYGSDALGGVMVIDSVDGRDLVRPGREHYVGGNAGYFDANDSAMGQGTYAYAAGAEAVVTTFSYRSGDAPDNRSRGVVDDQVDFHQWQSFSKWTHDFRNGGALRTSLDYFRRAADSELHALLGFGRFLNTTRLDGEDQQDRWRAAVTYALPSLGWMDEGSVMFYRQDDSTRQFTAEERLGPSGHALLLERDFKLRERNYGGEVRTRWNFRSGPLEHVLVSGVEWDDSRLTESRTGLSTDRVSGRSSTTLLGERFPLRDMPVSNTTEVGIYGQDEIILDRFSIVPALRWDHFDLRAKTDSIFIDEARLTDLNDDDLTLRIGATWRVVDAFALYANYAEGFRAPPAADVNLYLDLADLNVRALPNPDLKPERSRNAEAGLRLAWRGTRFEAGAYYARYEDFIESRARLGVDPQSGAQLFQSRNLAEASIHGVEAEFEQQLGALAPRLEDFILATSMHWAHGTNEVSKQPLNTVTPLKALFTLRWQPSARPWAADLHITHYAHQNRTDFASGPFFVPPARTVVDLIMHWTPTPYASCHFGLYNIGNQRVWSYAETRRLTPNDPRVELASWPGLHANFTVSLRY